MNPRRRALLPIPVLLLLAGVLPVAVSASDLQDVAWYGVGGEALPFQTEDQVLDFLRTAPIVETKPIGRGISGTLRVTLEQGPIRARAAFRTVDRERSNGSRGPALDRHAFRDHWSFEIAAHHVDRLLGLGRVPPTVEREIDGARGSLQLWVENAQTEADMIEKGDRELDAPLHLQRQTMLVFDNLIYNFDRHQNNMLYDRDGRLWYIDHTRSFKRLGELPDRDRIAVCDRFLFERLKALDKATLGKSLGRYLGSLELAALEMRRKQLVRHFESLIDERGVDRVLL